MCIRDRFLKYAKHYIRDGLLFCRMMGEAGSFASLAEYRRVRQIGAMYNNSGKMCIRDSIEPGHDHIKISKAFSCLLHALLIFPNVPFLIGATVMQPFLLNCLLYTSRCV